MTRKLLYTKLLAFINLLVSTGTLHAQFTGPYAPENWTFNSQNADGFIDLSNMPIGFTIAGNDDGLVGANSLYSIVIPEDGTIRFKWSYTTDDGPNFDPAGYRLNGSTVTLTDPEGDSNQGGEEAVVVEAGDIFSFLVDATDACCGRGFLTIETFSAGNTPPTLNDLSDIFSNVNPGLIEVPLEGITAGILEPSQTITITASSSNTAVIPDPVITYTSPETTGTLSFTPVTDAFGDATITVNVIDDGGTANGSIDNIDVTFNVSITSNLPPSIDIIDDVESRVNEVLSIDLTGIDAGPGETQTITVTAASSNQAVVANEDIIVNYTSPNTTGTLDINPVLNASGEAIIEVILTDDGGTADNGKNETTTFFSITVTPNGEPVINEVEDINLFVNAGEQIIDLTGISDGDAGVNQTLTITASSSNQALIPDPLVTYTSPDATGTLTINPTADQFGTATITVTLSDDAGTSNDGSNETSFSFEITVLGNFQPEINPIANIQMGINEPNKTIDLSGITAGVVSVSEEITVTATSSNANVVDAEGIEVTYTSPETTGILTLNSVADAIGESTITVTVTDDGSTENGGLNSTQETFIVRVLANRAPEINQIDAVGLDINADEQTINLTGINSGEDANYQTLSITATSDNTALIPDPAVTYTSDETTGSLTFTPVADAVGTAIITVIVMDDGGTLSGGVNSTTMTFEVTVSGNQPPTMNEIQDVFRTSTDAFSVNLSGISDGTGLVQNLILTATSDNPTIIPNPIVNYTAGSATGSLDFEPTDFGDATITVTITDDGGTDNGGVDTFTQTFNISLGGNQPPGIQDFEGGEGLDGATLLFNNGQGDQVLAFQVFDNGEDNIISVTVTSNNPEFEDVVSVTYNPGSVFGAIIFSPPAGLTGSGEFEVTVQDDGGTENNGVDTFVATMTVIFTEPTTYSATLPNGEEGSSHIQPFTVNQSGPVLIENIDDDLDVFFELYQDRFDPFDAGNNQIGDGSRITVDLEKDRQYILVTFNEDEEEAAVVALASSDLILADENTIQFTNAIGTLNGGVGFGFLPNLDFIEDVILDEDGSVNVSLSGISDGNGNSDNVSLSASSNNEAAFDPFTFVNNNDGTGSMTINPAANVNGTYEVTVTVTGENGSTFDRSFQVTINPVNDAPVVIAAIADQSFENSFGSASFDLNTVFSDVDESTELTFAASTSATGVVDVEVTNNTLTLTEVGPGTVGITVTADDGLGGEGSDVFEVFVNKINQTITFNALDPVTEDVGSIQLTATASSGLSITYTSSNTSVATVSGSTLTILDDGQATITASQSGDAEFNAATEVSQSLVVDAVLGLENQNMVKVYPNPTSDFLLFDSKEVREVQIFDLNGKAVISEPALNQINLSDLNAGTYVIKLKDATGKTISSNRIIKDN